MGGRESFSLVSADAFGASSTYQLLSHMSKVLSPVLPLPDIPAAHSCHVIIDNVLSGAPHH
jgi:hypothetical protein